MSGQFQENIKRTRTSDCLSTKNNYTRSQVSGNKIDVNG